MSTYFFCLWIIQRSKLQRCISHFVGSGDLLVFFLLLSHKERYEKYQRCKIYPRAICKCGYWSTLWSGDCQKNTQNTFSKNHQKRLLKYWNILFSKILSKMIFQKVYKNSQTKKNTTIMPQILLFLPQFQKVFELPHENSWIIPMMNSIIWWTHCGGKISMMNKKQNYNDSKKQKKWKQTKKI